MSLNNYLMSVVEVLCDWVPQIIGDCPHEEFRWWWTSPNLSETYNLNKTAPSLPQAHGTGKDGGVSKIPHIKRHQERLQLHRDISPWFHWCHLLRKWLLSWRAPPTNIHLPANPRPWYMHVLVVAVKTQHWDWVWVTWLLFQCFEPGSTDFRSASCHDL